MNKDKSIVSFVTVNAKGKRYLAEVKTSNPLGLALTDEDKAPEDYEKQCTAKAKEEVKNNRDKKYEIVKEGCTETKPIEQ